jgi:hypothetical protein
MEFVNQSPGVYKSEVFLPLGSKLRTGVPGFVGFVRSLDEDKRAADAAAFSKPIALHRKGEFESNFADFPEGYLADAVTGFFLNEGSRCYVVAVVLSEPLNADARANVLKVALDSLSPLTDVDLVAVPDAMLRLSKEAPINSTAINLQRYMLGHCATYAGRMAILDAMPGQDAAAVSEQCISITKGISEPINGALYYPWIKTYEGKMVPPSGHIAGIFARSDARVGVFKAPANEEIKGALDLELLVDNIIQGPLNSRGINCVRAFPGRGIRVWGARTLSRDPNWRYVNIRRLFLTLQRWIDLNMGWANFEPNTPQLWVRIARELNSYLSELWRAGALAGQTAGEAFYVKCDHETNPNEALEAGQTITEIGLAPSTPSEFIVVRIVHHTAVEPR